MALALNQRCVGSPFQFRSSDAANSALYHTFLHRFSVDIPQWDVLSRPRFRPCHAGNAAHSPGTDQIRREVFSVEWKCWNMIYIFWITIELIVRCKLSEPCLWPLWFVPVPSRPGLSSHNSFRFGVPIFCFLLSPFDCIVFVSAKLRSVFG